MFGHFRAPPPVQPAKSGLTAAFITCEAALVLSYHLPKVPGHSCTSHQAWRHIHQSRPTALFLLQTHTRHRILLRKSVRRKRPLRPKQPVQTYIKVLTVTQSAFVNVWVPRIRALHSTAKCIVHDSKTATPACRTAIQRDYTRTFLGSTYIYLLLSFQRYKG